MSDRPVPETPIDGKRRRRELSRDTSADGFRALHVAAYEDDAALATLLLEHGADPWARTRFNQAPLDLAADWNSPAFVRVFLAAGIDPDAAGTRPIVVATGHGHAEIVDVLLAAGARNGLGMAVRSACSLAAHANRVEMVKLLLARGADPTIRCHGRPLLHYLLVYDDYTDDWMAEDFDESRYDRSDPILRSEAVRLLIDAGAPLPWSDDPM